jgi:hypothetical protein
MFFKQVPVVVQATRKTFKVTFFTGKTTFNENRVAH